MSTMEKDQMEIAQLMQIRAIYQLTTDITKNCYDPCIPKVNPRMEDSERNCLTNCAANFLKMKLLYTRRLIESSKTISASISPSSTTSTTTSSSFNEDNSL